MEFETFLISKIRDVHEFLESLEIQSGSVQGVALLEKLKNILNLLALLETLNILRSHIQMRDRAKILAKDNLESVTVRNIEDVILVLDSVAPGQPINNFENILQSTQEKIGAVRSEIGVLMQTHTSQLESLEYKAIIQEIAISFDKRAHDIEGVLNSAIHKLELLRNTMAQDKIESLKEDILRSTPE